MKKLSEAQNSIFILDACRDNPFIRKKSSSQKGLAAMKTLSGKSQLIIFATEDNQLAYDGSDENSPFAEALVQNIENSDAKLQDMLPFIKRDVLAKTDQQQSPTAYGILMSDFYIKEKRAQTATPTAPKPQSTTPEVTWKTHNDQKWGYSFQYPSEWMFTRDDDGVGAMYYADGEMVLIGVIVERANSSDKQMNLAEWGKDHIDALFGETQDQGEASMISSGLVNIAGYKAFQGIMTMQGVFFSDEIILARIEHDLFEDKGHHLQLTLVTGQNTYDKYLPLFDHVKSTFRLSSAGDDDQVTLEDIELVEINLPVVELGAEYGDDNGVVVNFPPWWNSQNYDDFVCAYGISSRSSETAALQAAETVDTTAIIPIEFRLN